MSELNYDDLSLEGVFGIYQDAINGGDTMTIDALTLKVEAWKQDPERAEFVQDFLKLVRDNTPIAVVEQMPGVSELTSQVFLSNSTPLYTEDTPRQMAGITESARENLVRYQEDPELSEHLRLGFPKPRLTLADLHDMVKSVDYQHLPDGRSTIAMLYMRNGSTTIGKSQVLYAENNVTAYGEKAAYDNGIDKLWDVAGFKHYQDKYELELLERIILPTIQTTDSVSPEQAAEAQRALNECSPAVQLLARTLQQERMLRIQQSPEGEDILTKTIQDMILPAITGDQTTLEQAQVCQQALTAVPQGVREMALQLRNALDRLAMGESPQTEKDLVKVFMGYPNADHPEAIEAMNAMPPHLRHMAQAIVGSLTLIRTLREQNDELLGNQPVSNFQLTSHLNQAAGNESDSTDGQLRNQGLIIHEKVKELLNELCVDLLGDPNMLAIVRSFRGCYGATANEGLNDADDDQAMELARRFLDSVEYQQKVMDESLSSEDEMPIVNRYALRGKIQNALSALYTLAYYMGVDADDDHREMSRAKFFNEEPHYKPAIMPDPTTGPAGEWLKKVKEQSADLANGGLRVKEPADEARTRNTDYRDQAVRVEDLPELPEEEDGERSTIEKLVTGDLDLSEGKLPVTIKTDLELPAGRIELHAPSYPGYFDDLEQGRRNAVTYQTSVGHLPTEVEIALIKLIGIDQAIAMAKANPLPAENVLSAEELEKIYAGPFPTEVTIEKVYADFADRLHREKQVQEGRLRQAIGRMHRQHEERKEDAADEQRDEDQPELSADDENFALKVDDRPDTDPSDSK